MIAQCYHQDKPTSKQGERVKIRTGSKSTDIQKYDEVCTSGNTRFHHHIQLVVMFRPAPSRLILGEEEDHSFNPIKSHMWSWHGGECHKCAR